MILLYEFNWWCNHSDGSDQIFKKYSQSKIIFGRNKSIYAGKCNKPWLEHTNCPDIVWDMWWVFYFQRKTPSRLTKPFELSHEWINKNFKYQEPEFYSRYFDGSVNWPFEVPPGCTKTYDKKISTWSSKVVYSTRK